MHDATSDNRRARGFCVGWLNVFVSGESTVELEVELADVIPDFLESVERQAEDSTDVDVAEDAAF